MDPDDPVPVIRLLNRQASGYELDPEEALEVLEPMDSMVIGDVDTCLTKIRKYVDLGVDAAPVLPAVRLAVHMRTCSAASGGSARRSCPPSPHRDTGQSGRTTRGGTPAVKPQ